MIKKSLVTKLCVGIIFLGIIFFGWMYGYSGPINQNRLTYSTYLTDEHGELLHVLLADGKTVIYGFNVDLPPAVKSLATRERAEVRLYRVIYELLDDARDSMTKLLAPEVVETQIGTLEVKGVFRTLKDQVIAGGLVKSGKITAGLQVRAKRGDEVLGEAEITSVQREKIEAREVFEGDMCGLNLKTERKLQLEEGDMLEFFTREIVQRHL